MSENFKSFDDMKLYLENVSSKKSNPVKLKKKRQIPSSKQKKQIGKVIARGPINKVFNHPISSQIELEHRPDEKDTKLLNEIKYKDVILVGRANKCITDHHKVDNLKAIVKVITRQGNIKLVEFGASYCTECNKYFMEEWQLQKLKDIGRPMCRVPINERHNHHTDVENANLGVGLKTESIIHQYGYNVNAHENMTDKQRQIILMHIIENHIANKAEIKSHLTWLINHNSGSLKMENALAKWRADRQFVDKYMLGSYEAIIVRSITREVDGYFPSDKELVPVVYLEIDG